MASLLEKIIADLKTAQLNRNEVVLGVLRMLVSSIKNKEIEKRTKSGESELNDEEITAVISTEAKKRREATEQYKIGGRPELAEKETNELNILSKYLPAQLSEDEIKKIVQEAIVEIQATDLQDLGKVMLAVMLKVKGKADGGLVNKIVKEELNH